jgi:hypothetical protein
MSLVVAVAGKYLREGIEVVDVESVAQASSLNNEP